MRWLALPTLFILVFPWTVQAKPLDFNRDVRPILARNCFACHGPDAGKRKADLRLDTRKGLFGDLGGYAAFVPQKPRQSEALVRILDGEMPPRRSEKKLTPKQIAILKQWVEQGASWQPHWAFVPPTQPPVPTVKNTGWVHNPIDAFVLARLEREGLSPSPESAPLTLVRRLHLDLVGVPPTPEEADEWAKQLVGEGKREDAYERLVDSLLASPLYGERWARRWLDLARYADTNGYEKDRPRSIWPYRDWVIRALNEDMPFDQFTIEQLAGDMLPGATLEQRIATGFHRNTMLNEEGGIDPLEYRFHAMTDRVATTGTVWMGLTTGCAQCHHHKYDPISHTEYYQLMALLNNADEPDLIVPKRTIAERRKEIQQQIAKLEARLPKQFPPRKGEGSIEKRREQHLQLKFQQWLTKQRKNTVSWMVLRPHVWKTNSPKLEVLKDGSIFSSGDITKRDVFQLKFKLNEIGTSQEGAGITALRLEVLPDDRLPARGPGRAYYEGRKGDFFLSELTARANGKPVSLVSASHSYGKISIGSGNAKANNVVDGKGSTGWSTAGGEGKRHQLVVHLAKPLKTTGELEIEMLFERHFAASLGRFRLSATFASGQPRAQNTPAAIERLLTRAPDTWKASERQRVFRHFLRVNPELAPARKAIDKLRNQLPEFPTTMVLQERPADNPRKTHRHHRGEYLSPREEVTPGLPAIFQSLLPAKSAHPSNRLEFARWLVSRQNPLVGRVTVNRAWRAFFGAGVVRTNGDFGTQSEPPTHQELLDWLACHFMQQGWSLKRLHRMIVCSATYRQSSVLTREHSQHDPQNRLLARGPRHRVEAEMIRDILLKSCGVLNNRMFGPSVYPPQPASVTALAYGRTRWPTATGPDRYRRSLYTFSKRTAPFAAYAVFDAPTGENCVARRNRSNTPLQALTLMNDAMFVEMTQALAKQVMQSPETSAQARVMLLFRRLLTRKPTRDETNALLAYQQNQLRRLQNRDLDPGTIAGDKNARAEQASWVMVARVLMNLDETITKH